MGRQTEEAMPPLFSTVGSFLAAFQTKVQTNMLAGLPISVMLPLGAVIVSLATIYGFSFGWSWLESLRLLSSSWGPLFAIALAIFAFALAAAALDGLSTTLQGLFAGEWAGSVLRDLHDPLVARHQREWDAQHDRYEAFDRLRRNLAESRNQQSLVATRRLPMHSTLTAADVRVEASSTPTPGALDRRAQIIGGITVNAIAEGQPISRDDLLTAPDCTWVYGMPRVQVPITESVGPIAPQPGDVVYLFGPATDGEKLLNPGGSLVLAVADSAAPSAPSAPPPATQVKATEKETGSDETPGATSRANGQQAAPQPSVRQPEGGLKLTLAVEPRVERALRDPPPTLRVSPRFSSVSECLGDDTPRTRRWIGHVPRSPESHDGPAASPVPESGELLRIEFKPESSNVVERACFVELIDGGCVVALTPEDAATFDTEVDNVGNLASPPIRFGRNAAQRDLVGRRWKSVAYSMDSKLSSADLEDACAVGFVVEVGPKAGRTRVSSAGWLEKIVPDEDDVRHGADNHTDELVEAGKLKTLHLRVEDRLPAYGTITGIWTEKAVTPQALSRLEDALAGLLSENAPSASDDDVETWICSRSTQDDWFKEIQNNPDARDEDDKLVERLYRPADLLRECCAKLDLLRLLHPPGYQTAGLAATTILEHARSSLQTLVEGGICVLEYAADEAHRNLRIYYPAHEAALAPTIIGNTLRAVDSYADEMYQMDAGLVLPRLSGLATISAQPKLAAAQDQLKLMEWCAVGAGAVAVVGTAIAFGGRLVWLSPFVWLAASASCWLSYRGASSAARELARQMRLQIDLHRGDLLNAFGLLPAKPITARQERALWEQIHRWLEYGIPLPDQYAYTLKAGSDSTGANRPSGSSEDATKPAATSSAKVDGTR